MGLMAEAYARMLKALLPRGVLWRLESDSVISRVLLAIADELARIDTRTDDFLREIHPPTTSELLADFERTYGLPDPCLGESPSTAQRVASLLAKIASTGGQTPAYYIAIAEALGFSIRITEFREHTVEDDVEAPICDDQWPFVWQVNAPLETVGEITVEDTVEDPIAWFGNEQLECVLEELKPAHTTILFAYDEVVFIGDSITFLWTSIPGRNAGVNGNTTAQMLARFNTDVLSFNPKVVVILGGINDIYNIVTPTVDNIADMAAMAEAAGACVILCRLCPSFLAPLGLIPDIAALNAAIAAFNADLDALASANDYHIADYHTPMAGRPELFPDTLHPSAAGYEIMRGVVTPIIDDCLSS